MSTAALKNRLKKANSQTIPTEQDLTPIMLRLMPVDIRLAVIRIFQSKEQPGDLDNYTAWANENCHQIWTAWEKHYPRWRESKAWGNHEQV